MLSATVITPSGCVNIRFLSAAPLLECAMCAMKTTTHRALVMLCRLPLVMFPPFMLATELDGVASAHLRLGKEEEWGRRCELEDDLLLADLLNQVLGPGSLDSAVILLTLTTEIIAGEMKKSSTGQRKPAEAAWQVNTM